MNIFADTHTHLYLEAFDTDREEVLQQCADAGVKYLFYPNIDENSLRPMLDCCAGHPFAYPMLGLHPSEVREDYAQTLASLFSHWGEANFVGIGEIGMDLYWDKTYAEAQQKALYEQLRFAQEHDRPAIIHCRKAFDELWSVLKQLKRPIRGIFHCFAGDAAQARLVIGKGFLIGVGGTLTYKNSGLQEVVRQTGLEHLVLETDSPFLPPVPYRGQRNTSRHIPIIAEKVAELKNLSIEAVAEATTANAKNLFGLHE
ncbi:MAG: TatD family hydrolase [Bacteroidales bacterium]|nr:TatD family hydrolase [Bacteroidales bacterium]